MKNIIDKYRWLEEDSPKTREWVRDQEKITSKYLSNLNSKGEIKKRLKELMDIDSENMPSVRGHKYFFSRKKKGDDQSLLFVKSGLNGKAKLLINPNKLNFGVVKSWRVSKDAKYILIEFSKTSNDRCMIKVFDVESKKFLKDTITSERYPFIQCWNPDSSGFWYMRGELGRPIEDEKYFRRIYYHALGQSVKKDEIFFGKGLVRDDFPNMNCSYDGRYQIVVVRDINKKTKVYFRDALSLKPDFINITEGIEANSHARAEDGYIYLFTDHKAPNRKVLRRKIMDKSLGKWEAFIPESKFKLESHVLLKDYLALEYLENISSKFYFVNLKNGKKINMILPGLGSLEGYSSQYDGQQLFYQFSALNIPRTIFRLDLKTLNQKLYWKPKIKIPNDLELKQEWVSSKDGTKIPMFIFKSKNNKKVSPTLVNAYGGFGISKLPEFRNSLIPFVENGGVFILANIRGGGEFGKKWHESIIKNKQHKRFEDFAAVLKYLVSRGYTSPEKLAVWGGSNGGLLMSVMSLRYPKLFKVALIEVPVTDMLRFHLFNGGRYWIHEYGDPEDKKMREYLSSYSPYHNVEEKNYPSMMFMTADHDDRVHPMHTYKLFARFLENKKRENPLILRIEREAGHSGTGKVGPIINKVADMFSFLYDQLGV